MNAIKTCLTIGKKYPNLIFESISDFMKTVDSLIILRYLDIFNDILTLFTPQSKFSEWTRRVSIFLTKFISDSRLELRLAVINFYCQVLENDPDSFLVYQEQIWNTFDLPHKKYSEYDVESEGNLQSNGKLNNFFSIFPIN